MREETAEPERKGTEAADAYSVYEEIIKDNIEYEHFIKHTDIDRERLDEIVSLILETVCTKRKTNPYRRGRLSGRACQSKVYEAEQQPH